MQLGDCLMALLHGDRNSLEDMASARIGAIVVGQFVNVMIGANTKG